MNIRTHTCRLCRSLYMYPLFHLLEDIRAVGSRHLTEPVCSSGVIIAICFRIGPTWRAWVHAESLLQTQHEQAHSAITFCSTRRQDFAPILLSREHRIGIRACALLHDRTYVANRPARICKIGIGAGLPDASTVSLSTSTCSRSRSSAW